MILSVKLVIEKYWNRCVYYEMVKLNTETLFVDEELKQFWHIVFNIKLTRPQFDFFIGYWFR